MRPGAQGLPQRAEVRLDHGRRLPLPEHAAAPTYAVEAPFPPPYQSPDEEAAWLAIPWRERQWRLSWPYRCDRARAIQLRARSVLGVMERDMAVLDAIEARALAERRSAELARMGAERARLGVEGAASAGDVLSRASAYLARIDATDSKSAAGAARWLVRGFALAPDAALDLLVREYAPRYHRKLDRRELAGMVSRAAKASKPPFGCMLTEHRGERR